MDDKFSLKIDWLSFTFKATEDDKATFSDLWTAFLHYFPKFEDIMSECTVFRGGRGQYYDNCVAWNDNILICWDNEDTEQSSGLHKMDAWEHGINVCIPSSGLCNVWDMVDLPAPDGDFFYEYKEIYKILLERHCQISRLDLALDDFTKTYYPHDFLNYFVNNLVKSPCSKYTYVKSGKLGGETFYIGGRSNKFLRVYNKEVESAGKIKSIRYEIELHNRYANECSDMILNDNFDFVQYFEKYFMVIKHNPDNWNIDKTRASQLPTDPAWLAFTENLYLANKKIVFPKTPNDTNMNKTERHIRHISKSLAKAIRLNGYQWLFDVIHDVVLSDRDMQIVNDAMRIRGISDDRYRRCMQRNDITCILSGELDKCGLF